MSKTFIPLEDVRVASPCHAHWDAMDGNDRSRYCGSCAKQVYNLSEMTRFDAEELIAEKEGKLCVRYYQRVDGTIMTQDCPVGLAKARRAVLAPLRWVAAGMATFVAWNIVSPKATMGMTGSVTGNAAVLLPKAVPTAPRHSIAAQKIVASHPHATPAWNSEIEGSGLTMGEMAVMPVQVAPIPSNNSQVTGKNLTKAQRARAILQELLRHRKAVNDTNE